MDNDETYEEDIGSDITDDQSNGSTVPDELSDEIQALTDSFNDFLELYRAELEAESDRDLSLDQHNVDLLDEIRSIDFDSVEVGSLSDDAVSQISEILIDEPAPETVVHDGVGFYADLAVMLLVYGVLPIYVAYKIVRPLIRMFRHIV